MGGMPGMGGMGGMGDMECAHLIHSVHISLTIIILASKKCSRRWAAVPAASVAQDHPAYVFSLLVIIYPC